MGIAKKRKATQESPEADKGINKAHTTTVGNIASLLSDDSKNPEDNPSTDINQTYQVTVARKRLKKGSLVDRGANGGILGDDATIVSRTGRHIDVSGFNDHRSNDIPVVTGEAVIESKQGPFIGVFNQYGGVGKGKTVHSCVQLEAFGNIVNDKSLRLKDGKQTITTWCGRDIPVDIIDGLVYMKMRPPTGGESNTLPKVKMTSEKEWNPDVFDSAISNDPAWYNRNISNDQLDTPEWLKDDQPTQEISVNKMFIQTHQDALEDDMYTDSEDSGYDSMPELVPRQTLYSDDSSTDTRRREDGDAKPIHTRGHRSHRGSDQGHVL